MTKRRSKPATLEPVLAISVPQAAKRLGISRAHAFNLTADGTLPSIRLGGRLVVSIAALDRLLAGDSNVRAKAR